VAAHSWGENVFRNFLAWVERKEDGWTEKHVATYVNIAGCVLGVPKVPTGPKILTREPLAQTPTITPISDLSSPQLAAIAGLHAQPDLAMAIRHHRLSSGCPRYASGSQQDIPGCSC